jgi:cell division protein FtsI (penicillin-binding protein 3)
MVRATILLRSRILMTFVILFGLVAIIKLIYIQILEGPRLRKISANMHFEQRLIKPIRGNITDCNGNFLATTLPFYRLAIDPSILESADFHAQVGILSKHLSNFFKNKTALTYYNTIIKARQSGSRYLLLNKSQINHNKKQIISTWPIFNEKARNKGGILEKRELRFKPFGGLAARSIGYINEDNFGVGLEYSYNTDLAGIPGSALYKKTTGGQWKIVHNGSVNRPQHGYDIQTTLDINLQDTVHSSLIKVLKESKANSACVIVMEVQTGEIKAMVNLSRLEDDRYEERYNYAIGSHGTREPGSIFKLVSMIALLEETDMSLEEKVDTGTEPMKFYDRQMKEVKLGGYGVLTLQEIFEKSSNIGIAKLIQDHFSKNPQKFINYVKRMHLDKPTGIKIAGEGVPYIPSPKDKSWSGVSLPWMSIGYGLQLSPLQMLTLYNAVANNGVMVQPLLVKAMKQANKNVCIFAPKILIKKICSDKTLEKVRTMLEGVLERGTARNFNQSFYKISGKSGTANVIVNGKYTKDTYISFVGYFPSKAPMYSCIVIMDCPKSLGWHFGGKLASVVKDIADKLASQDLYANPCVTTDGIINIPAIKTANKNDLRNIFKHLNIHFDEKALDKTDWVSKYLENDKTAWNKVSILPGIVPNVYGMTLRDALSILENLKLSVQVTGNRCGRVQTQSIKPGTSAIGNYCILLHMK